MLSLKEVEFQFWEKFSHLEDCDDIVEDGRGNVVNNGFSFKQKRLNHADMPLYGDRHDWDVFSVVTCCRCGMILKPQALNDHLKKRHSRDSISDDSNNSDDTSSSTFSSETIIGNKSKRQKIESNSHVITESFQLNHVPRPISSQTKSFLKPKALQKVIAPQSRKVVKDSKIKMKLKKSDHGSWAVVPV